jgi:hypothetical protein
MIVTSQQHAQIVNMSRCLLTYYYMQNGVVPKGRNCMVERVFRCGIKYTATVQRFCFERFPLGVHRIDIQ